MNFRFLSRARWIPPTAMAMLWLAPAAAQEVKHIILFIGDGMQMETEIATSRYLFGHDEKLSFHKLPYKGVGSTWDVTTYNKWATAYRKPKYSPAAITPIVGYDPIRGGLLPYPMQTDIEDAYFIPADGSKPRATDSASAVTAWATGYKTDDGNLAWLPGDPPNGAVSTIAQILRQTKGFAIGVVSTVPFTHATPAGHVSHNTSRNNYHAIGDEILTQVKPEVVIGGGHPNWAWNEAAGDGVFMSNELYQQFRNGEFGSEYVFVERTEMEGGQALINAAVEAAAQGKKLFGLFGGPGGNFESPVPVDSPGSPKVLRYTSENPLLEHTVKAALTVLGEDPDGFFVMFEQGDIDWTAHANDFRGMVGTTWDLHRGVQAAVDLVDRPGDAMDWSNTLLLVTSDHGNSYLRLKKTLDKGDLPLQLGSSEYGGSGVPRYPDGEVTYSTTNHTNELVRIYAKGPALGHLKEYEGVWYPCTKIIDNTQLFHIMLDWAGVPIPSPLSVVDTILSCGE
jgi:alkaline phosphatase